MNQTDGWHTLQLGLSIGASAAAMISAVWAIWQLGRRAWNHTVGRRRAQAAILDQLACTVSRDYVEKLLGPPRFIGRPDLHHEAHSYSLPGGWAVIEYDNDAVQLLSITITDSKMWYRTGGMTLGVIDVKLGYDSFAVASPRFDGQHVWIGNKQAGYHQHYCHGGAGGNHQNFWLSYNAVGASRSDSFGIAGPYSSGIYGNEGTAPDLANITANTLTILSPFASVKVDVGDRVVFGPHVETVGLIWSERKKAQEARVAAIKRVGRRGSSDSRASKDRGQRQW